MKKDTQHRSGVRKINASATQQAAGDTRPPLSAGAASSAPRRDSSQSAELSARYIDSRLKQFCLR